ncbi:DUF5839 family protein [Oceanobacillus sojae]|uniref:Uncharacterized protein n=1 Tax=Oceanobacillus sojae TaxID=582851 RepID=A0A511ZQ53_9BACI|nr:DUF5839 family protein [Oceanobacillus sojae]GEN89586.1 hypothetical protein OSO01_43250 [Oceanobacillus sojae]
MDIYFENGNLKLNTDKMYHWHIHIRLRDTPIAQGDIVLVQTKRGNRPILVMNVFREEDKEKKQKYKRVIKLLGKAPEKSPAIKS